MQLRSMLLTLSALLIAASPALADGPKRLLLLGQGPDGHPAAAHEYVAGLRILHKCLEKVPNLEVKQVLADEPWRAKALNCWTNPKV